MKFDRPQAIRRIVEMGLKTENAASLRFEVIRQLVRADGQGGRMRVKEIKTLLEMAENLLATAEKLPLGPDRNEALETIRGFAAELTLLLDRRRPVGEVGITI